MLFDDAPKPAPERHLRCCTAMADLLSREFGAAISPSAVAEIFDKHWQRLSDLAHGIHNARREMREVPDEPISELARNVANQYAHARHR